MTATVLRTDSKDEVKKEYAEGIFDGLNLEESVMSLERSAKSIAQRMKGGHDVRTECEELDVQKEKVMSLVVKSMVAREKTLHRPRGHHAKAMKAIEDPAFVSWHKTRVMWIRRL